VTQRQCMNCSSSLLPDDVFCGICGAAASAYGPDTSSAGTAVQAGVPIQSGASFAPEAPPRTGFMAPPVTGQPWPGDAGQAPRAGVTSHMDAEREARQQAQWMEASAPDRFFSHAASPPAGPLSNATRYLCAAAYLDPGYANTVIGELIASHRGVVPSLGIDLVPIVRHCLNARRMQLIRDLMLTVFLLAGLFLAATTIFGILIIAFLLGLVLPGINWERHSIGFKVLIGAVITIGLGGFVVSALLLPVFDFASRSPSDFGLAAGTGGLTGFVVLVFLGLVGTTLFGYSYSIYRIFIDRLGPGSAGGYFDRLGTQVEARIAEVGAAQWGNVALYGGANPFIGSGITGKIWSIAIELDRASGPGKDRAWHRLRSRGYVPIDPVELHDVIRARLLKLGDQELPENERVANLTVHDHLVGDGHSRWDSPVIDHERAMPYSQASPEAIDALIRHPQAGMRYYQWICVSDEGQPVWSGQREVIGSADQEIAVSAFIYIAVEGRMLYLEFVPAVLPPILQRYHLVDRLPRTTAGSFLTKVFLSAASTACRDMLRAPIGVASTWHRTMVERRSFEEEAGSPRDYVYADVGARLSVREIRAALSPRTYIQQLDAAKYTKMIERLVNDTVLDFLEDKGVDTGAYRESAQAIINNSGGVMMSGGSIGGVAFKGGKVKVQNNGGSSVQATA